LASQIEKTSCVPNRNNRSLWAITRRGCGTGD
jgi:hypothetical protein